MLLKKNEVIAEVRRLRELPPAESVRYVEELEESLSAKLSITVEELWGRVALTNGNLVLEDPVSGTSQKIWCLSAPVEEEAQRKILVP